MQARINHLACLLLANGTGRQFIEGGTIMAGSSQTTTNHDEIKRWVEERGGHPATVKDTTHGDEAGLLRIDFPGYSGKDRLEPIAWDEFFQKFDEKHLAFLHQDETADGKQSRFCKLVSQQTASAKKD